MTALCGGGTSSIRPAYGGTLAFSAPFLVGLLVNWPAGITALIAGIVGFTTWDLATLCATDPPAMPTITAADVLTLIAGTDTAGKAAVIGKFHDLIAATIWPTVCQCDAATTPAPPSPPPPPAGLPNLDPPSVTPVAKAQPCYSREVSQQVATNFLHVWDFVFPINTARSRAALPVVGSPEIDFTATPGPARAGGFVQGRWTTTIHYDSDTTDDVGTDALPTQAPGVVMSKVSHPPASATMCRITMTTSDPNVNQSMSFRADVWCVGESPFAPNTPCCPPDPMLTGMLSQVYQLLTIVQRQAAPFAYVPGTNHPALTNSGEVAVNGLLGVKVTPVATPTNIGIEAGDPDTLWLDSWIRWGNPDGWGQREFLTAAPFVSLPALAGQYTRVGYSLRPGLTVDITELVREP